MSKSSPYCCFARCSENFGENTSLGHVAKAGIPASPGFAVTTAAYADSLTDVGIKAVIYIPENTLALSLDYTGYIYAPVVLFVRSRGYRRPDVLLRLARVAPYNSDLGVGLAELDVDCAQ